LWCTGVLVVVGLHISCIVLHISVTRLETLKKGLISERFQTSGVVPCMEDKNAWKSKTIKEECCNLHVFCEDVTDLLSRKKSFALSKVEKESMHQSVDGYV